MTLICQECGTELHEVEEDGGLFDDEGCYDGEDGHVHYADANA